MSFKAASLKRTIAPDSDLVTRCVRGEVEAFGELYDSYLDAIYKYVYYQVNDHHDAEDLTETIFLKAFEYLTRFEERENPRNFKAWLFRIARNQVIDFYRTRKTLLPLEENTLEKEETACPEIMVELNETQQIVQGAIDRLGAIHKQVVICRFISRLSHAETAKIMNLKESYVRVLQYRALKEIRQWLAEDGSDE